MAIADLCGFSQAFERELTRARAQHYPLCAVCVDLGQSAGDEVVSRVEDVLSASARATDVATRSSDREFVVLLPETNAEGAEILARRLYSSLREALWVPGSASVHLGIASFSPDMNAMGLLDAARAASVHARDEGASAVHVAR